MITSLPALLFCCIAAQDPSNGFVPAPWPPAQDAPAPMPDSLAPLFAGIESGPTPQQWRSVPVEDRAYLSTLVLDPQRSTHQRAVALQGLKTLDPSAASLLGQRLVADVSQPDALRVHAVVALDGLLTGERLLALLRPILLDAPAPALRAAAGQTLLRGGPRHACRLVQQQRERDRAFDSLWKASPTRCR